MSKRVLATAALTVILCAGCQPGALVATTGAATTPAASTMSATVLTGQVLAPAGVIAPGAGNYLVLAESAIEEAPLVGAEVFLADAAGDPIPGLKPVKTDAEGRYTIPDAKAGYTFVVVARAKSAAGETLEFQTIAKATELGATADVNAATTLVTVGLVDGQEGALGSFNPAKFKTAAQATKRSLKRESLPDFANRADVLKKIQALSEEVAEIRAALQEVKQELAQVKAQLAELKQKLEQGMTRDRPAGEGPADCARFFAHLDADGDGSVTLAEWTAGFKADPGDPTDPKDIFVFVDRNADGALTREEFVPECEKHQARQASPGGDHPGDCADGFRFMDQDRSGALGFAEFQRGHRPPPGEHAPPAEMIFKHLDRDGDGQVGESEFVTGCQNRGAPPAGQHEPVPGQHDPTPDQHDPMPPDCDQQFASLDRDGDRLLSSAEFQAGFQPREGESVTAAEVFGFLDANADGRVEHPEFMAQCGRGPEPAEPPPGE